MRIVGGFGKGASERICCFDGMVSQVPRYYDTRRILTRTVRSALAVTSHEANSGPSVGQMSTMGSVWSEKLINALSGASDVLSTMLRNHLINSRRSGILFLATHSEMSQPWTTPSSPPVQTISPVVPNFTTPTFL